MNLLLVACSHTKDERYFDNVNLEKPPNLLSATTLLQDKSSLPAKSWRRGLGEKVVWLSTTTPPSFILKQERASAWHTVELALRQVDIKIIDPEHDRWRYYVRYSDNFFSNRNNSSKSSNGFFSFFSTENIDAPIYRIALEAQGDVTKITTAFSDDIEQKEGSDDSEALLQLLYNTLRDNLINQ